MHKLRQMQLRPQGKALQNILGLHYFITALHGLVFLMKYEQGPDSHKARVVTADIMASV
jgi:hypothetical protein